MTITKPTRKKLVWTAALVFVIATWTFDPAAWRVRLRFPSAKITDCHEYGWLLPAFLHRHYTPPTDLFDGAYLDVELSDRPQPIDFSQFHDLPVFIVVLNRCKVADIQPMKDMQRRIGHFSVVFNDCDFSALPKDQRQFHPLPGSNRFAFGNQ